MAKITPPNIYILALKSSKPKRSQNTGKGGAVSSASAREDLTEKARHFNLLFFSMYNYLSLPSGFTCTNPVGELRSITKEK